MIRYHWLLSRIRIRVQTTNQTKENRAKQLVVRARLNAKSARASWGFAPWNATGGSERPPDPQLSSIMFAPLLKYFGGSRAAKNSDFVRVIGFFYPPLRVRTDIYAINDLFGLWTRYKIGINLNYSDTSHFAHAHGTS